MPVRSPRSPRPPAVIVATVCVALIFAITLFKWTFTLHWQRPIAVVLYFGFALLFFLFVRELYVGRRWVRWMVIWLGGISLLWLPVTWQKAHVDVLFITQTVLQVLAVILLLLPPSRVWFTPQDR